MQGRAVLRHKVLVVGLSWRQVARELGSAATPRGPTRRWPSRCGSSASRAGNRSSSRCSRASMSCWRSGPGGTTPKRWLTATGLRRQLREEGF